MWIFTKHGFFSAGCARQGCGEHGQPVDPDCITVRARFRSHLEGLGEGYLASMFENGHIVSLLQRLKTIREKMKSI